MLPFRILPIVYVGAFLVAGFVIWGWISKYGDYRADQVHQAYEKAVAETNADLSQFESEDNARTLRTIAELKAAAEAAGKVASELKYTTEQASALTRIRRSAE